MILQASHLIPHNPSLQADTPTIEPLNLTIPEHELVCMIGTNNSGKTRYLRSLAGVDTLAAGTLKLLNRNIWSLTREEWSILRLKIAYLGPDIQPISSLNALDNVCLPIRYHQIELDQPVEDRARELLDWLSFDGRLLGLPNFMTPFQRRLILLARALILQPRLLFIDEAFPYVDARSWHHLAECYLHLIGQQDMTVVMTTHNLDFVRSRASLFLVTAPHGLCVYNSWHQLISDDSDAARTIHIFEEQRRRYGSHDASHHAYYHNGQPANKPSSH